MSIISVDTCFAIEKKGEIKYWLEWVKRWFSSLDTYMLLRRVVAVGERWEIGKFLEQSSL